MVCALLGSALFVDGMVLPLAANMAPGMLFELVCAGPPKLGLAGRACCWCGCSGAAKPCIDDDGAVVLPTVACKGGGA